MWRYQCFETKEDAIEWARQQGFKRVTPMDLKKEIKKDPYNCIPYLAGVDTDKFKFGFQWRERE